MEKTIALNEALDVLDTFSKSYVKIKEIQDQIRTQKHDVTIAFITSKLQDLTAGAEHFRRRSADLYKQVHDGPKDYMVNFEADLTNAISQFLKQCDKKIRDELESLIRATVLT